LNDADDNKFELPDEVWSFLEDKPLENDLTVDGITLWWAPELTIDTMVICIVCKIQAGEELVPKALSSQPASQSLCIIPEAAQTLCPQ
jgi:hypothetical protein